jgi:hypothetical protein
MKYAILCNAKGETLCGSDGYYRLDARNTPEMQITDAREYRKRYKKHFENKYNYWTHVMFTNDICGTSTPIKL